MINMIIGVGIGIVIIPTLKTLNGARKWFNDIVEY